MQAGSLARRYARAIIELAKAADAIDRVGIDLDSVQETINSSSELRELFGSPAYSAVSQAAITRSLFEGKVHSVALNTMLLLVTRHRVNILPDVLRELHRLLDLDRGIVRVEITSTTALAPDVEAELVGRLSERLGKRVEVSKKIDSSLIGGLVTQVGHVVFDGSLSTQFVRMKRYLERGDSL